MVQVLITPAMRDLLIEHIDGPAPYIISDRRSRQVRAAVQLGYLSYGRGISPKRPRFTYINQRGREALAKALANWADALIRARYNRESLPPISDAGVTDSQARVA